MSYDLIIKNGTVVDGTGAPPREADVGVLSGKIVELGADLGGAPEVIDGRLPPN
jgi:N-acyl-D-amino-acid deacylase